MLKKIFVKGTAKKFFFFSGPATKKKLPKNSQKLDH